MALQKQALPINFASGLDTKTDPLQVSPGKFLSLENSVFDKGGLLQKRNGYGSLADLPDAYTKFVTTFKGNLLAVGRELYSYSDGANSWVDKAPIVPLKLSTLPLIRSNTNQSYADIAISSNNYGCFAFIDNIPVGGTSIPVYKYAVIDVSTGENIIAPVEITDCTQAPKVFLLGNNFIIVFNKLITATNHLQYIAINTATLAVSLPVNISSQHSPETTGDFDGVVANNTLYLAWNGSDVGGAIRMVYIDQTLTIYSAVTFPGIETTHMSVSADTSGINPVIYALAYDSATSTGTVVAVDHMLATLLAPTTVISSELVSNVASSADLGNLTFFYEIPATYTYDASIETHYVKKNTVTIAGVVGTPEVIVRGVGLASKAFIADSSIYFLSIYASDYQPTYFLLQDNGEVVAKLAYSNGDGYYTEGLPGVVAYGSSFVTTYLIKDLIQAANKTQGVTATAGIYSQVGANLAKFDINTDEITAAEIGSNLNISGGFLWAYDGYLPVENGFHLWPDYVEATTATTGGHLTQQKYFYVAVYEWSDNQGNIFRSAPSVPVEVDLSGGSATDNKATIHVPTLRLTKKIANPVKIVLYRWSEAQQTYYQATSITTPVLNDLTVDYVDIVDTQVDSDIIGNNILYTTGGVIENIGPSALSVLSLFKSRLFGVSAENENLLLFSKQVIQNTPVEMSDLLTIYVPPTIGAQGDTGGIKAMFVMDDKLVLFKKNAVYYIVGNGPDNTGANNDFSEATYISSVVGCENQKSIVFTPNGLMFQSDKGIWLLGRDLSSGYIGAPVEELTLGHQVVSANNIPGTNQVRFLFDSGITLIYDYYFNQWGTFTNVPGVSSTLYQDLHTYVNDSGQVFQETPGVFMDGSSPVLMSFKTSWFNLAGLQGYERAYFFQMLANYISPHKLEIDIAYDYAPSPAQSVLITPDNYSTPYGGNEFWGSDQWGGESSLEQWRVFFERQKCQSFQISLKEIFDPQYGTKPGASLTISGLNLIVGLKKAYRPIKAARSTG